jgi:hypothetical protein
VSCYPPSQTLFHLSQRLFYHSSLVGPRYETQSELTAITSQNELLADKLREGEESMSRLTEALRTQESKYQP